MEMPKGWRHLVNSITTQAEDGVSATHLKMLEEAAAHLKEMAEALNLYNNTFDHHTTGDPTAPSDLAINYGFKVIEKFKEWK